MPDEPFVALSTSRLHKRWAIVTAEGLRVTIYRGLGVTLAEVRRLYPAAQSIEVLSDTGQVITRSTEEWTDG